ncbi:MAG: GDSL-type esterase/lipase family protein [Lautropia sp.]
MPLPPSPHSIRPAAATLLVLATLGLAACGGGGESPSPAPTPPAPGPAPIAANACAAFPDANSGAVSGSLAASASSGAGGALTWSLVSQPASGTVSLAAGTGAYTYTPTSAARGRLDTFTYKVTDTSGASSQATASVIYGKPRILPLGDSITQGVEAFDGTQDLPADAVKIGYRKRLQELLTAGGYPADFVGSQSNGAGAGIVDASHEGHSGFRTDEIDAGTTAWLAIAKPDIVLLHVGTNDVNQAVNTATAVGNVNAILTKASAFAANATNPPVGLVVAKIVPQRPENGNVPTTTFNASLTAAYNSQWADAVNTNARYRVRMVDMFSALDPSTDLTALSTDVSGLHPNTSGYNKMAQVWFDSLVQQGMVARCP